MFGWLWKKPPTPTGSTPEPVQNATSGPGTPGEGSATPTPRQSSGSVMVPPLDSSAGGGSEEWGGTLEDHAAAAQVRATPSSGRVDTGTGARESGRQSPPAIQDAPDLLVPGVQLRAIPERQPATPRGWNVKILKTDSEGIWLSRIPGEEDPLPVSPREVLTLVIFDDRKQVSYDCPVIRIKSGNPEQVVVGRPLKSTQEKSKLDSIGARQHYRIETQLPVEVKVAGGTAKNITPLSGHTRDISRGGLCLVLPRGFDQGRELDVRVLSWNFPLQVRAKVVRCDEEAGGRYVVAVAFPEDLGAITRDLVGHFIMENQRGRT